MLIQLASFNDVHFDVDDTCPIKFIQDMLQRKRQARPSPIFPELRDFHLISEIVLADNYLPKQVPTEVFSRCTPFGLNNLRGQKFRQR